MTETAAPAELTARDALRHQLPDHPSAREAMYWVICLPEERIGISVYAYLKPTGEATQVVLAWDPELRTVLLDEIRDVPVRGTDLDDFTVGRLHMRQPDPLSTWDIEYAGDEMQLDFRFRALHRAFSYWENPNGSPLAFTSHNRIEQCGTVEGTLRFRGRRVHFRTTAHHDHSWGMRDWQAMMHYKWIAAQSADAQVAVHAAQVIWRGRVMVNGYVLRDGLLSPLVDARFDGTYESRPAPAQRGARAARRRRPGHPCPRRALRGHRLPLPRRRAHRDRLPLRDRGTARRRAVRDALARRLPRPPGLDLGAPRWPLNGRWPSSSTTPGS